MLVLFDASQQKNYIDNFQLAEEEISLQQLVWSHFIRWSIWVLSAVPLVILARKLLGAREGASFTIFRLGIAIVGLLTIVVLSVSTLAISLSQARFTSALLGEYFLFFFYQKGLTFFLAYIGVVLVVNDWLKSRQINAQWLEIRDLKATELNTTSDSAPPTINVKIGSRVKPIPIRSINWIQADDYCVRLHTGINRIAFGNPLSSWSGSWHHIGL
jgi:hypothetical protein